MRRIGVTAAAVLLIGACATAPEQPETTISQPEPTEARQETTSGDTHVTSIPAPVGAQEDFGGLAQLAGTRWRGVPHETVGDDPFFADITEWYWDLGGTVLANRHVLEDGVYGGVTYIQKNAETGALDYVYITSGGFRTTGQFTLNEDGSWDAYEKVEGLDDITGVRSSGSIDPEDGTLFIHSTYETLNGLMPGRAMVYSPYDGPMPDLKPLVE